MQYERLFSPLAFRTLTVKNRVFRSNVSGRFDNYDGTGAQPRGQDAFCLYGCFR